MKRSISVWGKAVGLVLGVALLPLAAHAGDDSGVYANLSVGQTKYDVQCGGVCTADVTATAYSGGVGYRINQSVAVEGGYANLGKLSESFSSGLIGSEKIGGVYLDVVGTASVSKTVDLNASIGEYFWNGSESCNFSGCGNEKNHDIFYGVGATYKVTQAASIGLVWNYYELDSGNANNAQVISARFQYQF